MIFSFLANTELFCGIDESSIEKMINCFSAITAVYQKGEFIYRCGETVESMGMVISGGVMIENNDLWGNRSILGHIQPGEIFAETYACIPNESLMVNAIAAQKTEVLFLNAAKIFQSCSNPCPYHKIFIQNLLKISAQKNLQLSHRILYTSSKSIRGRLMSFLSDKVKQEGQYTITIPFNRQQLADYLNVDRSAMCSELSKMQKDGILTYYKNTFKLKKTD